MLVITDGAALERALTLLAPGIRDLLLLRREQLGGDFAGHARFFVFEAGDRPRWLEEALGFSIFQNPGDGTWHGDPEYTAGFDTCVDLGFAYELTFELTSDFTHVVIVENAAGVCRRVLDFCAEFARQDA